MKNEYHRGRKKTGESTVGTNKTERKYRVKKHKRNRNKKERRKERESKEIGIRVSSPALVSKRKQNTKKKRTSSVIRLSFCSESLAAEEIRPEKRKERWKRCPAKRGSFTQKELCHRLRLLLPSRYAASFRLGIVQLTSHCASEF